MYTSCLPHCPVKCPTPISTSLGKTSRKPWKSEANLPRRKSWRRTWDISDTWSPQWWPCWISFCTIHRKERLTPSQKEAKAFSGGERPFPAPRLSSHLIIQLGSGKKGGTAPQNKPLLHLMISNPARVPSSLLFPVPAWMLCFVT